MFLTKKHLSRRTVLQGVGVTLSLPLLESMIPAQTPLAKSAAAPIRRFAAIYIPHGAILGKWTPAGEGTNFQISEILKPIAGFKDQLTVVSNLGHAAASAVNSDAGADHNRSAAVFLSGMHAERGVQAHLGVTADQVIAQKIGQETPLPSLELSIENVALNCGAGLTCAYSNTIAWKNASTPLPMENSPKAIFEKLFGEGGNMAERIARKKEDRSILDSVVEEIARLQGGLPPGDKTRVAEYTDQVREIERRIQRAEVRTPTEIKFAEPPEAPPSNFEAHAKLIHDLQVLAFQTDITRVSTLMYARELSSSSYPESGVREAFHACSHHSNVESNMEQFAKVNTYHYGMLAYFLDKLRKTPDGDGTLLDHSVVLYGSGMSNSNQHDHDPLPIVLVGGAAGQLKGGRHLIYKPHTPMSNLLLSLLDKFGAGQDSFGDSTGLLEI